MIEPKDIQAKIDSTNKKLINLQKVRASLYNSGLWNGEAKENIVREIRCLVADLKAYDTALEFVS